MNRRQVFLSHAHYHSYLQSLAGTEARWQMHSMTADSPEQEAALKAAEVKDARLHHLILNYTGGVSMEALAQELDGVIEGYEDYQRCLLYTSPSPRDS